MIASCISFAVRNTYKLDQHLFSLFYKDRFLDLIHNFIIFDNGIKKVCRHNQFFGIKKAQLKLAEKLITV